MRNTIVVSSCLLQHRVLTLLEFSIREDRFIQELHQWMKRTEGLDQRFLQPGYCKVRFQSARGKELFVAKVLDGRMILRKSAGRPDELFTGQISKHPAERARANNSFKPFQLL